MRRSVRAAVAALVALTACGDLATGAAATPVRTAARLTPVAVRIGQPAEYRGVVTFSPDSLGRPLWIRPDSSDALAWGELHASRAPGAEGRPDTLWVTTTVRAFKVGVLDVPGLAFRDDAARPPVVRRLPAIALQVLSVLTPADSNADLRPVRGPLAAPWWERVTWGPILVALAALAAVVALAVWVRRRRPRASTAVAPPPDPAARALEALAALRTLRLPEAGAFAQHAFALTSILRRYLEGTGLARHPGDTTSELGPRLRAAALEPGDASALVSLLRSWDQVKFARAGTSLTEARRAEAAVEAFVRRRSAPRERAAA